MKTEDTSKVEEARSSAVPSQVAYAPVKLTARQNAILTAKVLAGAGLFLLLIWLVDKAKELAASAPG